MFWQIENFFHAQEELLRFDQRARFRAADFGKIQMKVFAGGHERGASVEGVDLDEERSQLFPV